MDSLCSTQAFVDDATEAKEKFTYEGMIKILIEERRKLFFTTSKLYGIWTERAFLCLSAVSGDESEQHGWKVHVAVDDLSTRLFADSKQYGKQVTIYCYSTPDKDWESIFNRIETELKLACVQADRRAAYEPAIVNSDFLSYRNDHNGRGGYATASDNYNVANEPDPFRNFVINPPRNTHSNNS